MYVCYIYMYVTQPKIILLAERQTNQSGKCILEQGMMTLIRKPANWIDGRLAFPRAISSQSGFRVLLYTIERRGGVFSGPGQWQSRAGNRLLVDSRSLGWEEDPPGGPTNGWVGHLWLGSLSMGLIGWSRGGKGLLCLRFHLGPSLHIYTEVGMLDNIIVLFSVCLFVCFLFFEKSHFSFL